MTDNVHCRRTGGIFKTAAAGASVAALALAAGLSASSAWAGHLPGSSPELDVVGQFEVLIEDLTTDVWALGNYAYIGSFSSPICSFDLTGVRIIDISNPAAPEQVAFIKDKSGTRTNDVKVEHIETPVFTGDILVTTNEGCGVHQPKLNADANSAKQRNGRGGISIWDVTETRPSRTH